MEDILHMFNLLVSCGVTIKMTDIKMEVAGSSLEDSPLLMCPRGSHNWELACPKGALWVLEMDRVH